MPSHRIYLRSILILSPSTPRSSKWSFFFRFSYRKKTYEFLLSHIRATCTAHHVSWIDHPNNIGEAYKLRRFPLYKFLLSHIRATCTVYRVSWIDHPNNIGEAYKIRRFFNTNFYSPTYVLHAQLIAFLELNIRITLTKPTNYKDFLYTNFLNPYYFFFLNENALLRITFSNTLKC
jgi:hypothetical protein